MILTWAEYVWHAICPACFLLPCVLFLLVGRRAGKMSYLPSYDWNASLSVIIGRVDPSLDCKQGIKYKAEFITPYETLEVNEQMFQQSA